MQRAVGNLCIFPTSRSAHSELTTVLGIPEKSHFQRDCCRSLNSSIIKMVLQYLGVRGCGYLRCENGRDPAAWRWMCSRAAAALGSVGVLGKQWKRWAVRSRFSVWGGLDRGFSPSGGSCPRAAGGAAAFWQIKSKSSVSLPKNLGERGPLGFIHTSFWRLFLCRNPNPGRSCPWEPFEQL